MGTVLVWLIYLESKGKVSHDDSLPSSCVLGFYGRFRFSFPERVECEKLGSGDYQPCLAKVVFNIR